MQSLQGHFLVASPHLPDPNFFRTVVLMVQHDRDGALGLVLNRPTRATVADAWQRFANGDVDSQQPVFWGGPVEGPPLVLHSQRELRQSEVLPGVYLSSRKAVIERVIRRGGRFRLFFGYAGWGAGQLEAELDMGGCSIPPRRATCLSLPSGCGNASPERSASRFLRPRSAGRWSPTSPG